MDKRIILFFILLVSATAGVLMIYVAGIDAENAKKEAEYLANFPYTVKGEFGEFGAIIYLTEDQSIRKMSADCILQQAGTKITILENKNVLQIDSAQAAVDRGCPARFFLAANLADTSEAYREAFLAPAQENDPSLKFTPVN